MIALLRGRIAIAGEDHVVLDTGGVGYLVHCSQRTLHGLPPLGENTELRIVTQVREDAITLYGFPDSAEQDWFRLLQNIQGVGARVALSILSVLTPDELARALMAQDKAPLTRATGVGPKLAGRIISELKDRAVPAGASVAGKAGPTAVAGDATPDLNADAVTALTQLGYGRSEAFAAVMKVRETTEGEPGLDVLIRDSLRELAR